MLLKKKSNFFLDFLYENDLNELFENEFERKKKDISSILGVHELWECISLDEMYSQNEIKIGLTPKTDYNQLIADFNEFSH